MDERLPGAAPVKTTPAPPRFKDRSTGLVVFGALTLLMGSVAALCIPLFSIGKTSLRPIAFARHDPSWTPAMVIIGIVAAALIWLGIGSIKARRWACALMLIFSWSWLGVGGYVVASMAFILPKTLPTFTTRGTVGHPAIRPELLNKVMFAIFLGLGVAFVILPAVWTFFYRSPQVKATCDARDRVRSWTDHCPLPVLGFCLWLIFSATALLIMSMANHSVMPFFGKLLTGTPGLIVGLTIVAIWGYSAWSLYRLEQHGWWLMLVALTLFIVSNAMTFARHDVMELYQLMGHSPSQVTQARGSGALIAIRMEWLTAGATVPLLAYLASIKQFITKKP